MNNYYQITEMHGYNYELLPIMINLKLINTFHRFINFLDVLKRKKYYLVII